MVFSAKSARLRGSFVFWRGRRPLTLTKRGACVEAHEAVARSCSKQEFALREALRSRMHVGDTEPIPRPSGTRPVTHSRTKTGDGRGPLMHLTVADASVEGNRPIAPTPSHYAIEIRCCGSVVLSMKACDTKGVSCVTPRWSTRSHVP